MKPLITRIGENTPGKEQVIASLYEAMDAVQNDVFPANKAVVLLLDDSDGNFNVRFVNAGMKMSECVVLAECGKMQFLQDMGHVK